MAIKQADLLKMTLNAYPTYDSEMSELTADVFTEQGFEAMKRTHPKALSKYFGLMLQVWFQAMDRSHAKDPFESVGFSEYYDQPFGAIIQRMAVETVKPINPGYLNLQDGASLDPFVVRKPLMRERFFAQNFDYASMITIPDDFALKQIFLAQNGISEFASAQMEAMQNGYVNAKYLAKLEALNAALNSTEYPLLATQQYETKISDVPTDEELVNFQILVKNLITAMCDIGTQSGAFNAAGHISVQDKNRLYLLVRWDYESALKMRLLANTFNRDDLALPIAIVPVNHFGGLEPYKEEALTTKLYPAYNVLGEQVGFAEAKHPGGLHATTWDDTGHPLTWADALNAPVTVIPKSEVHYKDPNNSVYAVLADKGCIFEARQNPYEVEPIRNPRTRTTNYWASSPHNTVACDYLYNMITISKAGAPAAALYKNPMESNLAKSRKKTV